MSTDEIILVTGASGYIASHIVKQLLERGHRVRGTVRSLKDEKKVSPIKNLVENPKHELELVEADLLQADSWGPAIAGCSIVIHTASPFPAEEPKDENLIIKPAVDGTLNVLRACAAPGSIVKRVVLTSSVAAIIDNTDDSHVFSEKDFLEPKGQNAYYKSKILAEKAAWDFVKETEPSCFELAVINPGIVWGPILIDTLSTSMSFIKQLMLKEMPVIPDISMSSCDVRDVALAHIIAMTLPEAVNNRHIIVSEQKCGSLQEIALWLSAEFKSKGYNVPTTMAPSVLIKIGSLFSKDLKMVKPMLGTKPVLDNSRLTTVLKITPIHPQRSVIDMANSMIERKMIQKPK